MIRHRRRQMRTRYKPPRPQICSVGPARGVRLTPQSKRTGLEEKWFALTGRVVGIKAETDGDLHIALADATGNKPGIVVCELPAKPQWCEIRNTVFSWTRTKFPFHTSSAKKLNVTDPPIITVTGRAFFDIGHALKDRILSSELKMKSAEKNIHWTAICSMAPATFL